MQPVRVMCISSAGWPFAARIPIALARVGFQVATVVPPHSVIRQLRLVHNRFAYHPWAPLASIEHAIKTWSPDLLVCCDDRAVRDLHQIHRRALQSASSSHLRRLAELIESSLGEAANFGRMRSVSALVMLAKSAGIRCPRTIVVRDNGALKEALKTITYPVLLKADGSHGGRGVRFIRSEREVFCGIRELMLPISWPAPLKRVIANGMHFPSLTRRFQWPRTICLQDYTIGHPCSRAVICWRGKVLAGFSVEAVETAYEFGPASVVRVIEHPEMTMAAEIMVERLQLSGFIGFDFLLDRENKAWFLEINSRVTPIAHLHVEKANLPAALFTRLTGRKPIDDSIAIREKTIALFPQEVARSRYSSYPSSAYHDVPWEEPDFVWGCLNSLYKGGLVKWMRKERSGKRDQRLKKRIHASREKGDERTACHTDDVTPLDIK